MSLLRQLWLAIVLVTIVVFGGSAVIGTWSAKTYLEEQLRIKNLDGASVLATLLSQSPKDEVTIELLISSQFDTGHYQRITLVDALGEPMVELLSDQERHGVPAWLPLAIDIAADPGVAQVQDGWHQYGTLTLVSHPGFAYQALWYGMLGMLGWFLVAASVVGVTGSLVLRMILRPLGEVIRQADAVGDRRFVSVEEPSTPEFRSLVRAMNRLTASVRRTLEGEAARLEQMRRVAHHDVVSGLFNREHFLTRMRVVLNREDAGSQGVLVLWRLLGLESLNRTSGWATMDLLIERMGQTLREMSSPDADWIGGRLNGADFALLAPGAHDPQHLAEHLQNAVALCAQELDLPPPRLPAAAVLYHGGDRVSDLLTWIDGALQAATWNDQAPLALVVAPARRSSPVVVANLEAWGARLQRALVGGDLEFQEYPVVDAHGELLHRECVARLRGPGESEWLRAREFMPWLLRVGEGWRLDDKVIDLALDALKLGPVPVCVNLSARSIGQRGFLDSLVARIAASGDGARLWLEVPEHGVFQDVDRFRSLCEKLRPLGCRLGIEHMGHQIARLGELQDLGLDYVKIDAAFVHKIDAHLANQVFVRGIAFMAHSIGLRVIGEGVENEVEAEKLVELGIDGMTGVAITTRLKVAVA
jgi:EAL domain-containing protein (putative c-di-GMP-specific phosphodiesterase class I)/GGDEF domain-containing protein